MLYASAEIGGNMRKKIFLLLFTLVFIFHKTYALEGFTKGFPKKTLKLKI